jgi:CRISPR-associated protein Csh2
MEVKNRSELVFLYDTTDANPNGDPDENKPRVDEENERNIVTDVRLKRTIRDYLCNFKGYNGENEKDIFVREIEYEPGKIQDAKMRAQQFGNNREKILQKCIDVRLFGGTIPITIKKASKSGEEKETGSSITLTGPVQFKFGRSLHKVEVKYIKGTGAFASEAGKEQKTFREEYILPYSLICFYGIINENAAKTTKLSEEDVKELLDGVWNGTKNLITRSKIGQVPRLLVRVIYNKENYHIGDLDKKIKLLDSNGKEVDNGGIDGKTLRSIRDAKIDLSELVKTLKQNREKIVEVQMETNSEVAFLIDGGESRGKDLLRRLKEMPELSGKVKELNVDR